MKYPLLILWTLTVYVSCQEKKEKSGIQLVELADGIKLFCADGQNISGYGKELTLNYSDKYSGEYKCEDNSAIYVKFRTCDNCVELDTPSIVGLVIGNVVATAVVGVAVYLIASQSQTSRPAPTKKRSDRENLILNEPGRSNDHYQGLRYKQPRDLYDKLSN
ncbi:T-cell surface glycoprotein CD3 delta chain isoform X2 [Kryptolebias marmoratus]|uniref:T-cell surface glycoprotein CD3 delta chain isoform X2 n=1 Tax=Kryptolebias marmoratus TaxID=37003 RepID=UPI0007F8FAAA|nr:T-cell surface glycoprotein CD3 delta chain isoform X2 [Kryptolebias marmoratus]